MFKHILVPLDGSKLSEASLDSASVLAQKLKSTVTLLHIIEQDAPAAVHHDRHLTQPVEAEEYLADVARRAFAKGVRVKTHVHSAPVSDVARSIAEHVTHEFKPDLIVTCTHGNSGVRAALFGSIAQQVVTHGATPLLLIRPDSPAFKLKKMLVPLDPESLHDDSLPVAHELARKFDAELDMLSVIPKFSTLGGEQAATSSLMPATTQALLDLQEEKARADLLEHVEEFARQKIKATAEVARGDPASIILKTAERSGSDLIILTTHGKAGVGAFWARSVAPNVAQRTKTPLLLIPLS